MSGKRVVVIEDEPGPREVVVRALQGHGNDVVTFERGDAALRYLRAEDVDLVISDVHRPGMSGIELFEALRAVRPALARRFLFLTGDTVSPQTAAFLARHAVPHLAKPVEIPALLRAAARLLRARLRPGERSAGRRSSGPRGESAAT